MNSARCSWWSASTAVVIPHVGFRPIPATHIGDAILHSDRVPAREFREDGSCFHNHDLIIAPRRKAEGVNHASGS